MRATNPSLAAGERALPLGLGVTEGVGAVREAAVARQEAKVFLGKRSFEINDSITKFFHSSPSPKINEGGVCSLAQSFFFGRFAPKIPSLSQEGN